MEYISKICERCGVAFSTKIKRAKYCGSTCRSAVCRAKKKHDNSVSCIVNTSKKEVLHNSSAKIAVKKKKCKNCNRNYEFRRKTSLFCSTSCRTFFHKSKKNQKNNTIQEPINKPVKLPLLLRVLSKIFNWERHINE